MGHMNPMCLFVWFFCVHRKNDHKSFIRLKIISPKIMPQISVVLSPKCYKGQEKKKISRNTVFFVDPIIMIPLFFANKR